MTPITCHLTPIIKEKGWLTNNTKQTIDNLTVYPTEYFCPKDYDNILKITNHTYSIHHFTGSWIDINIKKDMRIQKRISNFFGTKISVYLYYLIKIYKRKGIIHVFIRLPYLIKKYLQLIK